jgi:phage-related tail fiber protein
VWNEGTIPAAIVPRIFHRYFSTKPEPGRGHGTWAMKALGEKALGGTVSFDTSKAGGTWFQLALTRAPDPLRDWTEEARGSTPRGHSPGRKRDALAA